MLITYAIRGNLGTCRGGEGSGGGNRYGGGGKQNGQCQVGKANRVFVCIYRGLNY